ncbi:AAA domain-containing protein [Vibrio chagasii]|nr:AAA domain-containing protein [Vibrio chagasii]CAH7319570.1 AAA domain-containing protein [Vibrio chagasii]
MGLLSWCFNVVSKSLYFLETSMNSKKHIMDFSDIHINLGNVREKSIVYYEDDAESIRLPQSLSKVANSMKSIIEQKRTALDSDAFRLKHLERLYRVTIINTVDGDMAQCRAQPMQLIHLDKIKLPRMIKTVAMHSRLMNGGLILVVGKVGSGKTTTCAAIAHARTSEFGGLLLTIEDPAELPLNGPMGIGHCIQMEVQGKDEFEDAGRKALRCFPAGKPGSLFISEIRDPVTASLALRASLDGNLVIATMHGDSITGALKRLSSYASKSMSDSEVKEMLSSGFRMCLHQSREDEKLDVTALIDTDIVSSTLRAGAISQLESEVQRQNTLLQKNELPIPRKL